MENILFGLAGLAIGIIMGAGLIMLIFGDSLKQLQEDVLVSTNQMLRSQHVIVAEANRISSRLDVLLARPQPKKRK